VALVTSPTGAAVRDFIRVARRRFENAALSIYPVRVQGEGAGAEIAQAVADLNRWGGFDLIVLTRGGGSLEDLWAFNEEVTARAVAASEIPVVSAVGHEVDFTITDFAADLRAPTPSAAAELIFREKEELRAYVAGAAQRMASKVRGLLSLTKERLAHLDTRLGDPRRALSDRRLLVDDLAEELILKTRRALTGRGQNLQAVAARLSPAGQKARLETERNRLSVLNRDLFRAGAGGPAVRRDRLSGLAARLEDLSPLAVLKRGYALARKRPGLVPVRSSGDVSPGERLNLLLSEGELGVIVDEVLV